MTIAATQKNEAGVTVERQMRDQITSGQSASGQSQMDRRALLAGTTWLVASSAVSTLPGSTALVAATAGIAAVLLVPRTGPHAALGRSMERASALAQAPNDAGHDRAHDSGALRVFDTGDDPRGAGVSAQAARAAGARIILGPLLADQVSAVVAAASATSRSPAIPVLSFSNDAALRESGAFQLGITALQSASAVLTYASGRGVRRVAVPAGVDRWTVQLLAAATELARGLGLTLIGMPAGGMAVLAAGSDTEALPDAVLAGDMEAVMPVAPGLANRGVQVLGAFPGIDLGPEALRALDKAWLAAPDPAGFAGFAHAYEERSGSPPGIIAGLAYDAARIVQTMRRGATGLEGIDRSALLTASGFDGVCGHVRFREDGTAARTLAVLAVNGGRLQSISPAPV